MILKSKTSKLILGTVQFGLNYGINNKIGKIQKEEAFKIIDAAKQFQIYGLDTAAAYGDSEKIIGEYADEFGLDDLKIITKFDLKTHTGISESFDHSLKKLPADSVEIVFFHNYSDYTKHKSDLKSFADHFTSQQIGLSIYTNEELEAVLDDEKIAVIQLPFNLLDNDSLRKDLLLKAKLKNKKVMTRSVFLQGLFFMNDAEIPEKLNSLKPYLDQIRSLAKEFNISIETLALHYVLSKSYIDYVLIGVDSLAQLKQNIQTLEHSVSEEVFEQIDAIRVTQPDLLNPSLWNL